MTLFLGQRLNVYIISSERVMRARDSIVCSHESLENLLRGLCTSHFVRVTVCSIGYRHSR